MNIGIVVPYFTPYVRGNEYGLAQSLSMSGYNVTIITSRASAPREKQLIRTSEYSRSPEQNFNVEYVPNLIDIGDNPITTGVKDHIPNQDLVMLQEDYPLICHSAYKAAKDHNIPTVLSSERTYYPENIAKRYALKVLDATSNKKLRNGVSILTAHCTASREFMSRELGVKREIKVIHVGVDTKLFRPVQPGGKYFDKGDFKILTTARLHRYKGLKYLIEAIKIVRDKIPGTHLYIIGKGQEEQDLKDLVKKLQLDSAVTFLTTPIPNYELPEVIAESDLYVQPSIIEPYGIAVLEAMACGKPVVGTLVGGMLDTISDGETGFLVNPGEPGALAERIVILNDRKLREDMGQNARKRALEKFDWRYIASRYSEIIDAIR